MSFNKVFIIVCNEHFHSTKVVSLILFVFKEMSINIAKYRLQNYQKLICDLSLTKYSICTWSFWHLYTLHLQDLLFYYCYYFMHKYCWIYFAIAIYILTIGVAFIFLSFAYCHDNGPFSFIWNFTEYYLSFWSTLTLQTQILLTEFSDVSSSMFRLCCSIAFSTHNFL